MGAVLVLSAADLKAIARARLADAAALLKAGRFDDLPYVCGYVVELALKARTCRTLKWPGFPEKGANSKGCKASRPMTWTCFSAFQDVSSILR